MSESTDLVVSKLDSARRALVEAKTIQETKTVLDVAASAEVYARRQQLGEEAIGYAHEIKTYALAKLGEMLRAVPKATGGEYGGKSRIDGTRAEPSNPKPTLADLGIDKKVSSLAQQIAALPMEKVEAIAKRVQSITDVQREQKEERRQSHRDENKKLVEKTETLEDIIAHGGAFSTIVIDPPWDWGDEGDVDHFGRGKPTYSTIPYDELLKAPVAELADKDAHLYLWITNRSLPKGFALIEAWGFRYVTCITWCKPSIGMGNYFRGSTEHLLFGVRGSLPLLRHDVGTWHMIERGSEHSEKPDRFFKLIESCSPGPYLELFGRKQRENWRVWGAEAA